MFKARIGVRRALGRIDAFEKATAEGIGRALIVIRDEMRRSAIEKGGTSGFWQRIAGTIKIRGSVVGTNDPIALHKQRGGIIRARNAKYLVFRVNDGSYRKVESVTQKPDPFGITPRRARQILRREVRAKTSKV